MRRDSSATTKGQFASGLTPASAAGSRGSCQTRPLASARDVTERCIRWGCIAFVEFHSIPCAEWPGSSFHADPHPSAPTPPTGFEWTCTNHQSRSAAGGSDGRGLPDTRWPNCIGPVRRVFTCQSPDASRRAPAARASANFRSGGRGVRHRTPALPRRLFNNGRGCCLERCGPEGGRRCRAGSPCRNTGRRRYRSDWSPPARRWPI